MSFEYFNAAGTATNAGVFIPLAALPGVTSAELNPANPAAQLQGNAAFGLLKQIYNIISPSSFASLGLSVANSESKPAIGVTTRTYSLTAQYLSDIATQTIGQIPVAGSGTNAGVGKFAISDIFPGASLVAAAGSVLGAGIVIETAALNPYGAPLQASLNPASGQDNRSWFAALFNWFVDGGLSVRVAGTTTSAMTAAVRGTPSTASLPANATASSNPTTGVTASQLNQIILNQVSYTISLETIDNQTSDTFSVNVA